MHRFLRFLMLLLGALFIHDSIWAQNEVLIFSVMGDIPYSSSEELILQQQIAEHNLYSPSEFMVHVGDIRGSGSNCVESNYSSFANDMRELEVPTFVIPGDNEWTDCSNPVQAWSFWVQYLMNFEQNSCGAPVVERQSIRPENFAFIKKGVLIIGLNMVGGTNTQVGNWNQRLQDNANWVNQQFQEKGSQVRAAVVFGHSLRANDTLFETQFLQSVSSFGKRVLYVMGEHHTYSLRDPYKVNNLAKVIVDHGAIALPLQVTVTLNNQQQFVFNRTPWNSNSQPLNRPPCGQNGPIITVNPTSHNYGSVAVGASASQTFVVSNTGNQNLDVTSTSLFGSNANEFTIDDAGAFTLSPGATRNMVVSFNPASQGNKSAALRFDNNDPNHNPLNVSVSGSGFVPVPDIAVNLTSHNFGQVILGASTAKVFVVSNTGNLDLNVSATSVIGSDAGEFSVVSGGGSFTLAPGGSRNIQVSFNPAVEGPKSATLRLDSDDPDENPLDVNLSGSGLVPVPDIAVNPTSHNFGQVILGASASKVFVVSNTGNLDLNVSSTSLIGGDAGEFSIVSGGGSFTLAPGGSRNIQVSFNPAVEGPKSATLRLDSDDPDENPLDLNLSGSGLVPVPDIAVNPTSHNFGQVILGASVSKVFVISNTGNLDLNVSSTSLIDGDAGEFNINSGGGAFILVPGATHDVQVSFNPAVAGVKSTTLRFDSNDPDENPLNVSLSGSGSLPGSGPLVFNPTADAYVKNNEAINNFGVAPTLRVRRSSTILNSYLKFVVSGLAGSAQNAKLRLFVTQSSNSGGSVYSVSNNFLGTSNPWTEAGLNYNNAPALSGSALSTLGSVTSGQWVEFDVTAAISGNGTYSFGLKNASTVAAYYSSKEGANDPELVINSGGAPPLPNIVVTPSPYDYGQVNVGQTGSKTFVVTKLRNPRLGGEQHHADRRQRQ